MALHHKERAEGVDPRLLVWLDQAEADLPFDLIVTAGIRTADEQNALYARGRTAPGPVVTNADAQHAPHCHGGAVDVAPLVNGDVPWNPSDPGYDLWPKIGEHAMIRGFTWGGCWKTIKDMPHVEVPDWRDLPVHS